MRGWHPVWELQLGRFILAVRSCQHALAPRLSMWGPETESCGHFLMTFVQAVFSIWNLLAFTTAPLEQAALTYIPASTTRSEQRTTLQLLLCVSVLIGVVCGSIACAVPLLIPQLLTKDAAVWPHMARVAPMALFAMMLTAADVGATGILLARRDLGYVARAFMVTLCALAVFVSVFVKGPYGMGLDGVWAGLVLFFGVRCVQSVGRLLWTNSKHMKAATA